jgi:hypothetical protein
MSSETHPIQDVIAGRDILQQMPFGSDSLLADHSAQDDSSPTIERGNLTRAVRVRVTQTEESSGVGLAVWGTTLPSLVAVSGVGVPSAAFVSYSALVDESFMPVFVLGSATTEYAAEKKSAFATCSVLLSARRGLLADGQFSALGRQLESLLADNDELQARGITVSPTSLDGLIKFLALHRSDAHPNVALTRDGRFTASWSRGKRAKITLVFDRDGGDWVGVDLNSAPPLRKTGAFVVTSLDGISQPFRSWIKA